MNPIRSCSSSRSSHHAAWGFPALLAIPFLFVASLRAADRSRTEQRYEVPFFRDQPSERAARIRSLAAEIDALYRNHADVEHIPGVAYGVVADGALVIAGAHGFADVEKRVPATTRTVFRVASMTKSFTAMALLRLRDRGRVDLDGPASKYLPELRGLTPLAADAPAITLRHLLTHGAGFPEDNPWGDRQLADSVDDLVGIVRGPVAFSNPAGIAYEYSNLGFALAGRAVGRMGGSSCQGYISRHILGPLGMTSTYWEPARVPSAMLAHGYRWADEKWTEEAMLGDGSYAPMGGLMSTVEDFAKYMALHLSAWPPREGPESPVLRRSSIREMHHPWRIIELEPHATNTQGNPCPIVTAYGYGLAWARDCDQRVRVGHSGGLPGFGSQWRMLPEHGIGVVALGNRTYAGFGKINAAVLALLVERAGLGPRDLPPSTVLKSRAEALVRMLPDWNGAKASGLFAENFFPDRPIDALRRETREHFERIGALQLVEPVRPENHLRGTVVLRGSQGALEMFFTLTPENPPLVQELQLREHEARDGR